MDVNVDIGRCIVIRSYCCHDKVSAVACTHEMVRSVKGLRIYKRSSVRYVFRHASFCDSHGSSHRSKAVTRAVWTWKCKRLILVR